MRRKIETAVSVLLAITVVGVGCGICLLGTLAARGDLSWRIGETRYRMWLIREQQGTGLALAQTLPEPDGEGKICQRTRVWFWLWTPHMGLQPVDYRECPPSAGPAPHRSPLRSLLSPWPPV